MSINDVMTQNISCCTVLLLSKATQKFIGRLCCFNRVNQNLVLLTPCDLIREFYDSYNWSWSLYVLNQLKILTENAHKGVRHTCHSNVTGLVDVDQNVDCALR